MVSKSGGKLTSKPAIFPTETQFGVFTRKGSELTQPVTAGIKQLIADGTLPDLAKKYGLDPSRLVSP
jgi:polar amino acid transport system substrate-binding protein